MQQRYNYWQLTNWEKCVQNLSKTRAKHLILQQNHIENIAWTNKSCFHSLFRRSQCRFHPEWHSTSSFGKPDSRRIKSRWSDMELWVDESILILTSKLDLVLSLEEIYCASYIRSKILCLHIETDARRMYRHQIWMHNWLKWHCPAEQVQARVPIFSLK